jgi:hypothetical protein
MRCQQETSRRKYPRQGANITQKTREKREIDSPTSGQTARFPPELLCIIDAWPRLPKSVRDSILVMGELAPDNQPEPSDRGRRGIMLREGMVCRWLDHSVLPW